MIRRQSYGQWLFQLYGCRVQKLNVNLGFSCPNRDGTLGRGGCTYCNNASFTPGFGMKSSSVTQQLQDGKRFYRGKYADMKYVAYFQSFTSTYSHLEKLRCLYEEALSVPDVVGIVISTRPDCVGDDVLDLLQHLNQHHRAIVEIGVESAHDRTLNLINRCHTWQCASEAIERVAKRGLAVGVHLILGLPDETISDMCHTVTAISRLPVDTVKFHHLQVLQGTALARQWESGIVKLQDWSPQDYAELCRHLISLLPENIVVERLVSQAPQALLLHPRWGLKPAQFKTIFDNLY